MSVTKKTARKPKPADPAEPPYYKVLVDGRSCHGGAFQWSLPTEKKDWDRESSRVEAREVRGSSTVNQITGVGAVSVTEHAVHIDRRAGVPIIHVAVSK